MNVVFTKKGRCKECYGCIRSCVVKAVKVIGKQATIMGDRCISCGSCIPACNQGAIYCKDETGRVRDILSRISKKIAIISPTFPAAFNGVNCNKVITALKELGFDEVWEAALGGEIVNEKYQEIIRHSKPSDMYITSHCAAIINIIERHYPVLLPNLIPLLSPMLVTAKVIKKKYPNADIVYIGPCVAKKVEVKDPNVGKEVEVVITYKELKALFEEKKLEIKKMKEGKIDSEEASLARLFLACGGMVAYTHETSDVLKLKNDVLTLDSSRALETIRELAGGKKVNSKIIDIYFCRGCIDGPVMDVDKSYFEKRESIINYVVDKKTKLRGEYKKFLEDISIGRTFSNRQVVFKKVSKSEVDKVLRSLGKYKEKDVLNCGACGYSSCKEKAIAVTQGIADEQLCLPSLIKKIASEKNRVIEVIINSMNDVVFTMDNDLKIDVFNDMAEKFSGYSKGEAKGKLCRDIFCQQVYHKECDFYKVLTTKKPVVDHEREIVTKDGRRIQVSASVAPLFDIEGNIVGGVEVLRDITLLKEIDKMKSSFVSNVSHELRTPLTSIKGSVELLLGEAEGPIEEGQRIFLNIIKNNTERLIRLINDLLDLAKIESGKVEMHKRLTSINELVKEVIISIYPLVEEKGINLENLATEPLSKVMIDEDRIKQVLVNLISNAIKFTPPNGLIKVIGEEKPKEIVLSVKDNGIGIDPANFKKIFTKFQSIDVSPAVRGQVKGTNLGLSICKNIVEAHGGKIWVESKLQQGSTFLFTIPKMTKEEIAEAVKVLGKDEKRIKKVLVVDDDPDVVRVIKAYLMREGMEVSVAYDGNEAIRRAREDVPDIMTLDILMPGKNGFEVIEELRIYEETKSIPIIIISVIQIDDQEKIFRLGIADYLNKPIEPNKLISCIKNIEKWVGKPGKKKRILIADDEKDVITVVRALLQEHNYLTMEAYNGREAVEMTERRKPDLIIMDIMMPEMDGFEAIRRIKLNPDISHIPIIVLTVRNLEEDKIKALMLGASEYLNKPFTKETLIGKIKEKLGEEGIVF